MADKQFIYISLVVSVLAMSCSKHELPKVAGDDSRQRSDQQIEQGGSQTDSSNTPKSDPTASETPTIKADDPAWCQQPVSPNDYNISSAPISYGIAKHGINSQMKLGANVYSSIYPHCQKLDNDGFTLPNNFVFNTQQSIALNGVAPAGGTLAVWVDTNANGVFEHPSERVFEGGVTSTGVSFQLPANPTNQASVRTWIRFRFGPFGLTPTETANVGEVEDYEILISN